MSYRLLRKPLFKFLRAPAGPPPLPPGSPASVEAFQPARGYLLHQLTVWGSGFAFALIGEFLLWRLDGTSFHIFGRDITLPTEVFVGLPIGLAIVLTIAAAIGKYYLIRLDYDLRYYIVTDRNVRIRQGEINITEATYTFANVQNLSIRQGPVERLFGVSKLIVETAGGANAADEKDSSFFEGPGHRGVLAGISNPVELRDQIQARLRRYRDAGLGDPDDDGGPAIGQRAPFRHQIRPETMAALRDIRDEIRAINAAL